MGLWGIYGYLRHSGKPKFQLDAEIKFCWFSIWNAKKNAQWCSLTAIHCSSQVCKLPSAYDMYMCLCVCVCVSSQWGVYTLTSQPWSWQRKKHGLAGDFETMIFPSFGPLVPCFFLTLPMDLLFQCGWAQAQSGFKTILNPPEIKHGNGIALICTD